jgi:hypothetical protein
MFNGITRKRLGGLVAALAALALAALVAAGAARAGTAYVYTDAAGDSASAPDVQKVTLTDGGNGTVGVEIDLAATIADDGSGVALMVDTDRNRQTGSSVGAEYIVCAVAQGASIAKWDGTEWSGIDHQPLDPTLDGGQLTFTLTLSDLGTTSFDFVVATVHEDDVDVAPEDGVFTYPQAPAKPTIKGIMVNATALFPKAGKTLTIPKVQLRLSTDEIVSADSVTCTLSYKGTQLAPVRACTWKLPKALKGKSLKLKLTAAYQGETSTLTLPIKPD